jgi:hypothetical protein
MAANKKWSVQHRCGHRINWDLSHKPPDRQVGFATWLAMRDCTRCWWTKRRSPKHQTRAISRPPRTARQQTETQNWEKAERMPVLSGSDKAVSWAIRIRRHLLLAARGHLGATPGTEEEFARRYADPAKQVTIAAWWIDHRRVTPDELQQVLAPASHQAGTTSKGDQ